MHRFNQLLFVAVFSLILVSCKKDPPQVPWPSGKADFSRYIAVGNSLTAGYSNGGLYLKSQQNAYPLIIAGQMKTVGGGDFAMPFFPANQANGTGYLKLTGFNADGTPIITRETSNLAVRGQATIPGFGNVTLLTKYSGELNNYGVPGIRLDQITYAPLGNLNPFYERLLPLDAGENNTAYIDFVTLKPFTFFSCWLGNNDVLGYATSGGTEALTDKSNFAALYSLAINKLTATNAKGVVATIPDVTSVPYLNTVTIPKLIAGVKKINPAVSAIFISALDPVTGLYAARPATESDYVVLEFNTANLGGTVNGLPFYGLTPSNPLRNSEILDKAEAAKAKEYVDAYNASIKSVASSKGLAVFDAYEFLNKLKAGMIINGVSINSDFITGGAFSLDGIHLTARGYAMTANEFIKAINSTYHSTIPQVNISTYAAVLP